MGYKSRRVARAERGPGVKIVKIVKLNAHTRDRAGMTRHVPRFAAHIASRWVRIYNSLRIQPSRLIRGRFVVRRTRASRTQPRMRTQPLLVLLHRLRSDGERRAACTHGYGTRMHLRTWIWNVL